MTFQEELSPIAGRVTVQDGVYLQLRHALVVGRFDPGQSLTISSLAKTFQTSHMPVREALRRLAAENALEIAQNGSAKVPPLSVTRLDDLCRARIALEGLATEIAATRLAPEEIDGLETLVRAHESFARSAQVYEMLEKNREFHMAVYKASGSDVLMQLIDMLWARFGPYMRLLSGHVEPRMKSGIYEPYTSRHHTIIAACRAHDAGRAREEMVADIRTSQDLLRTLISG